MKNYKNIIENVVTKWCSYAESRMEAPRVNEIQSYIRSKLGTMEPVVSVYGAYNAGKSTLLNALTGEELCATGDVPETHKVEKIKWGDWTIYDTPGIDAPIQHQEITEEHLRKSECILFVISTNGDFESKLIYEKLGSLVKRGKPVLLIFNDKSGILNKAFVSEGEIYEKIQGNIDKIWIEMELEKFNKPEKILVNAQSALKAKLSAVSGKPKPLLLQQSRVPMLERKLEEFIRETGEQDIVNAIIDYMQLPFDELTKILSEKLETKSMQKIQSGRIFLDNSKRKILVELEKFVRKHLKELCDSLSSMSVEDFNRATSFINQFLEGLSEELAQELQKRLENVSKDFEVDYYGPIIELNENNFVASIRDSSIFSSLIDEINTKIDLIPREAKIAVLTGAIANIGSKIKVAGNILNKYAGSLATLILSAFDIFMDYRQEKKLNAKIIAQHEAIENSIRRIKDDTLMEYVNIIRKQVDEFIALLNNELSLMESAMHSEQSQINMALEDTRMLRNQLEELRFN